MCSKDTMNIIFILVVIIISRLKECEAKLQLQVHELTRRENVLNMRLATKQEEMRNLLVSYGVCMCVYNIYYSFEGSTSRSERVSNHRE